MTETSATKIKNEFIKGWYNFIMETLARKNKSEYADCFKIEGSSIMCSLPTNYFNNFDIPAGQRIEIKFISKKG